MKKLFLLIPFMFILVVGVQSFSSAAKYDIKEMTPQVKSALENRKARYSAVRDLKDKGVLGEDNRGYVALVKEDSRAADIMQDENRDRKIIYQTIADQHGLSDEIDVIEKAFAVVKRNKAKSGDYLLNDRGQWERK